ncbi:hypothetical protein DMUE_1106 [Dictyocoela muelleri]|nr:hypothetical protein DMUE_1106 [Dictyocoela muelleri]
MSNKSAKKILFKNIRIRYQIEKISMLTSSFAFVIMLLSSFQLLIFIYTLIELICGGILLYISKPKYKNGLLEYPGVDLTRKGIISVIRDILWISWVAKILGLFFNYSYFVFVFVPFSVYYEFWIRDMPGYRKW